MRGTGTGRLRQRGLSRAPGAGRRAGPDTPRRGVLVLPRAHRGHATRRRALGRHLREDAAALAEPVLRDHRLRAAVLSRADNPPAQHAGTRPGDLGRLLADAELRTAVRGAGFTAGEGRGVAGFPARQRPPGLPAARRGRCAVTATAAAEVELDVRDAVATVTLNRPDKLNAVTPGMAARIGELLRSCDADPAVRAIVLTGRGRGFCSGADLAVIGAGVDELAGFVADPSTFPVDA